MPDNAVAILQHFWEWVRRGCCRIKDKDGQVVSLQFNQLQRDMFMAMLDMARAGKPLRLIILKSRKMGCSTFVAAFMYFLVKHYAHIYIQLVAHTDASTKDIFEYAARMYVEDPDWSEKPKWPLSHLIDFQDSHDSKLAVRTFAGLFALSSANLQGLLISELAKTSGDSEAVKDAMASLLNSVADTPTTFIFIESTANNADQSGEFEDRCRTAMRGEGTYRFVFSPWFHEPTYTTQLDEGGLFELTDQKMRAAENELRERQPELSDQQLKWRRDKIADMGSLLRFDQDFPETPEHAFQRARGKVFAALGEDTHDYRATPEELEAQGFELRRGFDWGGADPFVSLWVWHKPGASKFTMDWAACPALAKEMRGLVWNEKTGQPKPGNDHGPDALRYVVTFFNMTGWVHVACEFYDRDFAADNRWIADNAADVKRITGDWPVSASVGDRSRPDCITAFRNQGVYTQAYQIEGVTSRPGEILFGIDRLNMLIVASHPYEYPLPPPTEQERVQRLKARGLPMGCWTSLQQMQEFQQYRETTRRHAQPVGPGASVAWGG